MKKIIFPLLLAVLIGGGAQAQSKKDSKQKTLPVQTESGQMQSMPIGSAIPMEGIMMMGVDDRQTSLRQVKTEKGLLVMFSCNTCPFVIKAQRQTFAAIELARSLGIGTIIVNSNQAQRDMEDSREAMKRYAKENDYRIPYVLDEMSQLANAFGATRTPEVFLFGGDGKLVYKGALEDNPADPAKSTKFFLTDAMNALQAKKPINPSETKSIGCSIKRAES